jgi:hypothetical protein
MPLRAAVEHTIGYRAFPARPSKATPETNKLINNSKDYISLLLLEHQKSTNFQRSSIHIILQLTLLTLSFCCFFSFGNRMALQKVGGYFCSYFNSRLFTIEFYTIYKILTKVGGYQQIRVLEVICHFLPTAFESPDQGPLTLA